MPRARETAVPPGRHRAFRRWAALMVRELERVRPGVYVAARGSSRVLIGFAGRLVTIDHDAPRIWMAFEGSGVSAAPLVLERCDAVSAAAAARTLAAFFDGA